MGVEAGAAGGGGMTSCNIIAGIASNCMFALRETPGGGSGKLSVSGMLVIHSGGTAGGSTARMKEIVVVR